MANSDDFSRTLPFGVRRGTTQDPADRTPKRGATTGIGPDGRRVVHVPDEGVHDADSTPPAAIQTADPNLPGPRD